MSEDLFEDAWKLRKQMEAGLSPKPADPEPPAEPKTESRWPRNEYLHEWLQTEEGQEYLRNHQQ